MALFRQVSDEDVEEPVAVHVTDSDAHAGLRPAHRVGGNAALDGFLEPVGDIARQAARVVQLLTDEELYQSMAQAARRTAVERFASSKIIPQYEKYYGEVLAG